MPITVRLMQGNLTHDTDFFPLDRMVRFVLCRILMFMFPSVVNDTKAQLVVQVEEIQYGAMSSLSRTRLMILC
jgi:hypothetical protein